MNHLLETLIHDGFHYGVMKTYEVAKEHPAGTVAGAAAGTALAVATGGLSIVGGLLVGAAIGAFTEKKIKDD